MTTCALRRFLLGLREEGRCVILSSHIMQEVGALCDHIVIIAKGTVMAAGSADELRAQSGEPNFGRCVRETDRQRRGPARMSMMSTLMTVMRKELRDLSRDRRTLLLTLLFGPCCTRC